MNDEILAFLVGDRGASTDDTHSSPQRNSLPAPSTKSADQRRTPGGSRNTPRNIKRVSASFHSTLRNDWIGTDDLTLQIVKSIANLRERLWQGNKFLRTLREEEEQAVVDGGGMVPDDIVLMLDHDLKQHENMMAQLRRSVAQMAQAQDAIGRRLDEWYKCCGSDEEEHSLEDALQLYKATGCELYRKQLLTQDICISGGSVGLLQEETDTVENPRQIAKEICEKWARKHKESHL